MSDKAKYYVIDKSVESYVTDMGPNIPEEFMKYVPTVCGCGAPMAISDTRKTLRCVNLKCMIKSAHRMAEMFDNLGVKGYGYSMCLELMRDNSQWDSHVDAIGLKIHNFPIKVSDHVAKDLIEQLRKGLERPMTVKEAITCLALPGLNQNANKIFKGFDSIEQLFRTMSDHDKLYDLIGLGLGSYGKTAQEILNVLACFWPDIYYNKGYFNIVPDVKKEYKIAVTGDIWKEKAMRRLDFPQYVSDLTDGEVGVNICKAFASVEYVIADSPSSSKTYQVGESRGILITSKEFCDMLRKGLNLSEHV